MALPQRARRVLRSIRQAIPAGVLLGRVSAGNGPAEFIPITEATNALLDDISAVQGSILYRGASVWEALAPGTSGQFLSTLGAAANPAWDDTGLSLPYADFDKVVFQSNFEGADAQTTFVDMDDSIYNHEITGISTAHITTSLAEFGASSLDVLTSGEAVRVTPCGDEFDIGAGAFFIEFFLAVSSTGGNAQLMGIGSTGNGDALFKIQQSSSGSQLRFFFSDDGTTFTEPLSSWTVSAFNVFRHTVIVRDAAGNLSTFIEGVRDDTAVVSNTFFASLADLIIGGGSETILTGRGRFDGVRIGVGTTGPYDPTQSTITEPTVYYGTMDNNTDLVRTGLLNKYYCRHTMLEDFSNNIDTAASNVTVTFGAIDKQLTLVADDQLEALSSTQGAVAFRGAAAWEALAPGTLGQHLTTKGAAANPEWDDPVASPHLQFFDPIALYDIREVVGQNPRTAIISSIASDVITLTTATAASFFRDANMNGNTFVRIWNTTKTPDEPAWLKAQPSTTTLTVTDAADIAGWSSTDVIQIGDPVAETPGRVIALDISQALATGIGGIQQAEGYLVVGAFLGGSADVDSVDVTNSGVAGSFVATCRNVNGGDGTTSIRVGPLSPISDSNLLLIRENIATTATIRFINLLGVYVSAASSVTFSADNESLARDWYGL